MALPRLTPRGPVVMWSAVGNWDRVFEAKWRNRLVMHNSVALQQAKKDRKSVV